MPAETLNARMQLRLTRQQWHRVQALAKAMDIAVSSVVRQAIDDFFARLEALPDDELDDVIQKGLNE
jgi:predicted transcriptional regulator